MSLAYYNSIRKNGYEYRERNIVGLGRDMHAFVGNMSYVMDFTILENIETNIDLSLSNVLFGQPFVEIACLAINRKYELMTFKDGIKEITFKMPYKIILSEDDLKNGAIELYNEDGNEFIVNKQWVKPYQKDVMGADKHDDITLDDEGEVT
ncbi:hypothetical protein Tco_1091699 [Tanacetum coccineum]|uniref:Uncharacterized protein n=1 Tax=Tanacetum coccineum TaxID=301880 RepID=A0ABQ5I7P7_9ASTR